MTRNFIISIFFLFNAQSTWAADSYQITAGGGSQYIAEWGMCATVTNNGANDLFVPTKSVTEWIAFLAATVTNVSVSRQACSCRSLLAMGNTTDGDYTIDTDGPGAGGNLSVYCDMTTDGGGWTLVGRSVASGSSSSFGWTSATGSVANDAAPYSFDVGGNNLGFSEILFGRQGGGKAWGTYAYKHTGIPKDFVSSYASSDLVKGPPTAVIGANSGFSMAARIGQTSQTGTFWFRDSTGQISTYGLKPFYWNSITPPAAYGGYMHTVQSMIMVR